MPSGFSQPPGSAPPPAYAARLDQIHRPRKYHVNRNSILVWILETKLFSGHQNQTGRLKSQNLGQTFMLFNDDTASIADDLPPMNTQSIYKRIQTYPQELAS